MSNAGDFLFDSLDIKPDTRPSKGGWATGYYMSTCRSCEKPFVGAKRAFQCSDCAYGKTLTASQNINKD